MDSFHEGGCPSIPEYFKGKTIFLTGGTGFLGKVLIEKLLWSCPDLDKIYVLMRPKKGKDGNSRLQDMEKLKLFERLRTEREGVFFEKVISLSGDVTELGLGLSEKERQLLIDNVSVIFHSAASVRFDDPLRDAVLMNTRGAREIMNLANEMKKLEVLLHVSTTYCNTDKNPVLEKLYPPLADWKKTIEIAEKTDPDLLKVLTPKYLGNLPNTYTFSKNLAEHVINDLRGEFSTVILRPSIVVSSLFEPMPGWIENFNGPVGLLVASGKGIMRSVFSLPEIQSDYMPVDIAIKAIIVATWKHGIERMKVGEEAIVYNCSSSTLKDVTLEEIINIGRELVQDVPLNDILWMPGGGITRYSILHYIKIILFHILPAILVDTALRFSGKKPMLVKIQRKIYIANMALSYYIRNQWIFKNDRLISLRKHVIPSDREAFSYDFEVEDVYIFMKNALVGARRYLLNEPDHTIPKAKKHYNRMYYLDWIVQSVFWGFLVWYIFNCRFTEYCLHSMGIINVYNELIT